MNGRKKPYVAPNGSDLGRFALFIHDEATFTELNSVTAAQYEALFDMLAEAHARDLPVRWRFVP